MGRKGPEEVDKEEDYWIGVALALPTSKHPELHCYTMDLLLSGQKVLVTLIDKVITMAVVYKIKSTRILY